MTPEQQMAQALIAQLKGEVAELEAVLWFILHEAHCDDDSYTSFSPATLIARDLLAHRRRQPEARARLIAEYQAWRARR